MEKTDHDGPLADDDAGNSEESVDGSEGPREKNGPGSLTRADVTVLYETERNGLFRLAWLACGDRGAAEDAVQDAFARLYQDPGKVRRPDRAMAYVRSVVLNSLRTIAGRNREVHFEVDPIGTDTEGPALASLDARRLAAAMPLLSDNQRLCIVCRYYGGLSDTRIAEATGLSLGTVKTHLRRGLTRLRRELDANPTDAAQKER